MSSIGIRLKQARKQRNLSQDSLAKKVGASRGVIVNLELDRVSAPQTVIINAICDVLQINKNWLLHGLGNMENSTDLKEITILDDIYLALEELSAQDQMFIYEMVKLYIKFRT